MGEGVYPFYHQPVVYKMAKPSCWGFLNHFYYFVLISISMSF